LQKYEVASAILAIAIAIDRIPEFREDAFGKVSLFESLQNECIDAMPIRLALPPSGVIPTEWTPLCTQVSGAIFILILAHVDAFGSRLIDSAVPPILSFVISQFMVLPFTAEPKLSESGNT